MTDDLRKQEFHRLLAVGEAVIPGDDVWDDDLRQWEAVRLASRQRVRPYDVVRRLTFDIATVLDQLSRHLQSLRHAGGAPSPEWWRQAETYISEGRRRAGVKTIGTYERDER